MGSKDKLPGDRSQAEARNEDPISGEPGAHPVGTGAGAAVGGAAAGALAGAVGGPIGAVVGAIAGGVGGAYAGKAIAENIDPTLESDYWRDEYSNRPYYSEHFSYDDFAPAYRAGWEAYDPGSPYQWADREQFARERWEAEGGSPKMSWEDARQASEDAYQRVHRQRPK